MNYYGQYLSNPHPLDSIALISQIEMKLEAMIRMIPNATLTMLLNITRRLPGSPTAPEFAYYLSYFTTALEAPCRLTIDKVINQLHPADDFLIAAGTPFDKFKQLGQEIHQALHTLTRSYIDDHTTNSIAVSRLIRKLVTTVRPLIEASYASPGLATQGFIHHVSQLDSFTWELANREKKTDQEWSIPRWAALRRGLDIELSIYSIAVLDVAEIISGYAGSNQPVFINLDPNTPDVLEGIFDALMNELDPFENTHAWRVYALLGNKPVNYYLVSGRL